MHQFRRPVAGSLMGCLLIAGVWAGSAAGAETVSVAELKGRTHVHGLALDRRNPGHLLIATHHGLFRSGPDGRAELISPVQDFMGFVPDPAEAGTLFASGHPAGGGNLGFIASTDNGVTWRQVAKGVDGPVDFHQLTVSPVDPQVIYGAYGVLQVTRDAGKIWSVVGPLPERLIDLAASAQASGTLYAATETGLSVSRDGGRNWEQVLDGGPVSLVEVTADSSIYVFVLGQGLLRSSEEGMDFNPVRRPLSDRILLHLAVDPADGNRMFAASHQGEVLASTNGGASWDELGR